ncbi:hypothetical protein [Anabaena sp. CCY 9402-a]|uniref:hypothetical protein n=1 Tax=Anabaena sp. CCY 9402-a TaxID=3103867 RepID=UPI0039C70442
MLKWSRLALAVATVFLIINQKNVQGIVINGSFEDGFNGWTTTGQTTVEDNDFLVAPAAGTYQAVLETLQDETGISGSDLETFLGLSSESLNLGVFEGSAIKQVITVNAGDKLTFSWNFLTDEEEPNADFNDFAFFSLSNVNRLADTYDTTTFSFSRLAKETGYQPYTYNFTTAGTYYFRIWCS